MKLRTHALLSLSLLSVAAVLSPASAMMGEKGRKPEDERRSSASSSSRHHSARPPEKVQGSKSKMVEIIKGLDNSKEARDVVRALRDAVLAQNAAVQAEVDALKDASFGAWRNGIVGLYDALSKGKTAIADRLVATQPLLAGAKVQSASAAAASTSSRPVSATLTPSTTSEPAPAPRPAARVFSAPEAPQGPVLVTYETPAAGTPEERQFNFLRYTSQNVMNLSFNEGAMAPLAFLQAARQSGYKPTDYERNLEAYFVELAQVGGKSSIKKHQGDVVKNNIVGFFAQDRGLAHNFLWAFQEKLPAARAIDQMPVSISLLATMKDFSDWGQERRQRLYGALHAGFKAIGEEATFLGRTPAGDATDSAFPTWGDPEAEVVRLKALFQGLSFEQKYTFAAAYIEADDALKAAQAGPSASSVTELRVSPPSPSPAAAQPHPSSSASTSFQPAAAAAASSSTSASLLGGFGRTRGVQAEEVHSGITLQEILGSDILAGITPVAVYETRFALETAQKMGYKMTPFEEKVIRGEVQMSLVNATVIQSNIEHFLVSKGGAEQRARDFQDLYKAGVVIPRLMDTLPEIIRDLAAEFRNRTVVKSLAEKRIKTIRETYLALHAGFRAVGREDAFLERNDYYQKVSAGTLTLEECLKPFWGIEMERLVGLINGDSRAVTGNPDAEPLTTDEKRLFATTYHQALSSSNASNR